MKILTIVPLLLGSIVPVATHAADDVELTSHDMGNGIYMIIGRGGNLGVSIGEDGVFLVDDQYAPLTNAIRAEIRRLSDDETVTVDFVLNTHFHPDHTGGNENFGNSGALVVAHENVRSQMTTEEFRMSFLERGGKSLADALPVVTFNDQVSFHLNGETLRTKHFPRGHTDGDSVVFFEGANVVHAGDLYFQVGYPYVDTAHGGSVNGLLEALDSIIAQTDENTRVIPGHGKPSNRAELVEYRDMIRTIFERVQRRVEAGKTLAEIQAENITADYDERWNWRFISGERFVETIFGELNR